MNLLRAFALAIMPQAVAACSAQVCLVDPASLALTQVITFDGTRSSPGPGHPVDDILVMDGAQFGERFAGQAVDPVRTHDTLSGMPRGPLVLMPGAKGQNLAIVNFDGNPMINGYGTAGFPRREAQGEGAIAVLFDADQSAFSFEIRGGDEGSATVTIFARDGRFIAAVPVAPTGEHGVGFLRAGGIADIAGFVLTNRDPQGLAMDTLRFGKPPEIG